MIRIGKARRCRGAHWRSRALPPGRSAAAQELKIGIKTEPSSLDPQFHTLNPNIQVAQHFFDALVLQDENLKTTARRSRCRGRRSTTRPGNSSCAPT